MSLQNKNFKNGDVVRIVGLWNDCTPVGKIVGCSMRHITDFYIVECVQLRSIEPTYDFDCAVFPEGNLERL